MDCSALQFSPEHITFSLLSHCDPDTYDLNDSVLAVKLARFGFETRWLFMGSREFPHAEKWYSGRLMLHRWYPQTISGQSSDRTIRGSYQPLTKIEAFNAFAPKFIMDFSVCPSIANGRIPVIIGQGWQTADALMRIHQELVTEGLRQQTILLWLVDHSDGDFTSQRLVIEACNASLTSNPTSSSKTLALVKAAVLMAIMLPRLELTDSIDKYKESKG